VRVIKSQTVLLLVQLVWAHPLPPIFVQRGEDHVGVVTKTIPIAFHIV